MEEGQIPAAFNRCVNAGGRVRTVTGPSKEHGLKKNQFVKYCFRDGQSHRGHVHTKSRREAERAYARKAKKVGHT